MMKQQVDKRPLSVSLLLSIILHIFIFILYANPAYRIEMSMPIPVEYLPVPEEKEEAMVGPVSPVETDKIGPEKRKAGLPGPVIEGLPLSPPVKKIKSPQPAIHETKAPPVSTPAEIPTAPSPTGTEALVSSSDQTAAGSGEGGAGGSDEETVSMGSPDYRYSSYLYGVRLKIEGVWKYPDAAKKSALQGKGLISFTINRDGTMSNLKLIESSGHQALDEAVLSAVRASSPFNPMARNIQAKKLNVVTTFEYNLTAQRLWGR